MQYKMSYTPKSETLTGADLTGSSPAPNRTYELANDNAIIEQMRVMVAEAILQPTENFTFNSALNTITFLTTVWDDQPIALDYLVDDSTDTNIYTPEQFTITGPDLTGSDNETDRIFTFTTNKTMSSSISITKDGNALQNGVNFIFNLTTKAITFLTAIQDVSTLVIDFYTLQPQSYPTTLEIVRWSGLGSEVELETLGTGNGTLTSYDVANGNIIDNSYTLFYGASDSNKLTTLVEGTDYQIALDDGRIELFVSATTTISTDLIYITYTHSPKQSDTVLVSYFDAIVGEVEKDTCNYWGTAKTTIQYYDGYDSGYPQTDKPFGTQIDPQPEFELDNQGINSITSVIFLDRQGNVERTLDSTEYKIVTDDDGNESRVVVLTTIPNGKMNVKITYVHGYTEVPALTNELAALIGGVMALVNISGGSYNSISVYQIGRKNFSLGEVYINVRESIDQIEKRIDKLAIDLGGNFFCV